MRKLVSDCGHSLLGYFSKANIPSSKVSNRNYLEWTHANIRLEWLVAGTLNSQDGGSAWHPVQETIQSVCFEMRKVPRRDVRASFVTVLSEQEKISSGTNVTTAVGIGRPSTASTTRPEAPGALV
jgi:hypothetical protein